MSLQTLLADGGRVLIVGARRSNAPEFWDHPQCVFLQGLEVNKRGVPANTKAILITRFVRHSEIGWIQNEARKRHITIFPHIMTGALKTTLGELLAAKAPPKPMPKLPPHFAPVPAVKTPPITPSMPTASSPSLVEPVAPAELKTTPDSLPETVPSSAPETVPMVKRRKRSDLSSRIAQLMSENPEWGPSHIARMLPEENPNTINSAFYRIRKNPTHARTTAPKDPPRMAPGTDLLVLIDDALTALQLVREAILVDQGRRTDLAKLLDSLKAGL